MIPHVFWTSYKIKPVGVINKIWLLNILFENLRGLTKKIFYNWIWYNLSGILPFDFYPDFTGHLPGKENLYPATEIFYFLLSGMQSVNIVTKLSALTKHIINVQYLNVSSSCVGNTNTNFVIIVNLPYIVLRNFSLGPDLHKIKRTMLPRKLGLLWNQRL